MMHGCTQCGTQYDVSDREPGFRFRCANCNAVQIVGHAARPAPAKEASRVVGLTAPARRPAARPPSRRAGSRRSADRGPAPGSTAGGSRGKQALRYLIVGAVVIAIGAFSILYYSHAQTRKEQQRRQELVSSQMSRLEAARTTEEIQKELGWFEEHPEVADLVNQSSLGKHRDRLARMKEEEEYERLLSEARTTAVTDKDAAKAKYRELITWCEDHEGFGARSQELSEAILRLDPTDEAAHRNLGKELVEFDLPLLGSYKPFFPEQVEFLQQFTTGKWLFPENAGRAREQIEENAAPLRAFIEKHTGDPYFQRALARIQDVLGEERFDSHMRAYYRNGCLVFHEAGLGRPIERDLAEMNLAALEFARKVFETYAATLPHKVEPSGDPLILVSLKDQKSYYDYNDADNNPWIKRARAYYSPFFRWITTYNEHIPGRFFKRMMTHMVETSIHEGSHHVRHLHQVNGVPLQPSYWFEEGWAEFEAGAKISFDQKEHTCHIEHTGYNESRLESYCTPGQGRDSPFFPRLNLQELVSLHTKNDERRLGEERARKANQPFTQGWQDSVFSHVYWQGYSFIYFCYHGSENRYKKQMDEWRAWQWSMASISSYTSGGYMQAWRKFKEIFGDTDKVQAEWWAWEDSLEF